VTHRVRRRKGRHCPKRPVSWRARSCLPEEIALGHDGSGKPPPPDRPGCARDSPPRSKIRADNERLDRQGEAKTPQSKGPSPTCTGGLRKTHPQYCKGRLRRPWPSLRWLILAAVRDVTVGCIQYITLSVLRGDEARPSWVFALSFIIATSPGPRPFTPHGHAWGHHHFAWAGSDGTGAFPGLQRGHTLIKESSIAVLRPEALTRWNYMSYRRNAPWVLAT
jgi:hypothetical protein